MRLLLLGLLAPSCSLVERRLYAPIDPGATETVRFTVPRGATAGTLGPALADAGLIASEDRWRLFLKLSGEGSCLKAGDFALSASMSLPQIMDVLCGVPLPDDVPFTVVEGWRIRDIDQALAAAGFCEAGAFRAVAEHPEGLALPFTPGGATLEGYLFPDTYQVSPSKFRVEAFVERQAATFWDRFGQAHAEGHDLGEVVIMASLLEREERTPANRPTTAGVLYKRLRAGWNLGVDATSRYTLADWNDREAFLVKLRDPDDPYNTRLRGGLPPTAIGNAGLDALRAAVAPVDSPYWYYLHDAQGVVHWARDAREHEQNRARFNVY
jgi:UPF0755 protein